jgi:hypothetical protein
VGAELLHVDGGTDRHDVPNSCFSQFCERALKNSAALHNLYLLLQPWRHRLEFGHVQHCSLSLHDIPQLTASEPAAVVTFCPQTIKKNVYVMNTIEGTQ